MTKRKEANLSRGVGHVWQGRCKAIERVKPSDQLSAARAPDPPAALEIIKQAVNNDGLSERSSGLNRCGHDVQIGLMFLGKQAINSFVFLLISSTSFTGGTNNVLADHIPVIPGAAGFGIMTHAGRGGAVYKVTNLRASGLGSLQRCISHTGPRVCVFEVSGTIKLTSNLKIKNPYITMAGQTAPSPGIMIRGAGIVVKAHDVLIQHLRVRPGDAPDGPNYSNRDALIIANRRRFPSNIVIDHCSFSWATDENVSLWYNFDNVTISQSIISEGLNRSWHPKGAHSMGILVSSSRGRISMTGNLFAHNHDRSPLSGAGGLTFVNNVVYNWMYRATNLRGRTGIVSKNDVVGNVYIRGPDYKAGKPVVINSSMVAGSKVYVEDNEAAERTEDPWSVVSNKTGKSYKAVSRKMWPKGLIARSTANNEVLNWVLANAGARPADRDSVDKRIITEVRTRTGRLIDSVSPGSGKPGWSDSDKSAGGWPVLRENSRRLTLPENPDGDDDGDGYTNLEEWLHAFAAEVEGQK